MIPYLDKLSSLKSSCNNLSYESFSSTFSLSSAKANISNTIQDASNSISSDTIGDNLGSVTAVKDSMSTQLSSIAGSAASMDVVTSNFNSISNTLPDLESFETEKITDDVTGVVTEKLTSVGIAAKEAALSKLESAKSMLEATKTKISSITTTLTTSAGSALTSAKDMATSALSSVSSLSSLPSIPTIPGMPKIPSLPSLPIIPSPLTLSSLSGVLSQIGLPAMPTIPSLPSFSLAAIPPVIIPVIPVKPTVFDEVKEIAYDYI